MKRYRRSSTSKAMDVRTCLLDAGLAALLLAPLIVCQAKEPSATVSTTSRKDGDVHWTLKVAEKNSPYPVLDSGVWAAWNNLPNFYWLDSQRLIYTGSQTKGKPNPSEKEIQIWNIATNQVTPYAKVLNGISCFRDGKILYEVGKDKNGNSVLKYGKLGEETTIIQPKKGRTYFDRTNCGFDVNDTSATDQRRQIEPLLVRHGYLDFGSHEESRNAPAYKRKPILYYRTGQKDPIPLAITNEGWKLVDYYAFQDAYYIHPHSGSAAAWWLYPNGRVEEVKFPPIPATPKNLGNAMFFPLRKGFFISYEDKPRSERDPGESGGYYLREDGQAVKLISGYTRGHAVSPDGCKVAFSHYPYIDATRVDDPGRITLKAINFCTEEKKQ